MSEVIYEHYFISSAFGALIHRFSTIRPGTEDTSLMKILKGNSRVRFISKQTKAGQTAKLKRVLLHAMVWNLWLERNNRICKKNVDS